jgi:acetyltransferase
MIAIRPLVPQDAERVQQFVRALSGASRLERFFAPIAELTPRQLDRVVRGGAGSLAAFDADGRLVGLAECVAGEFGVVVADDWQGRGVGERLIAALVAHARRSGMEKLTGITRASNRPMRRLAAKLGFRLVRDPDPVLVRVERMLAA